MYVSYADDSIFSLLLFATTSCLLEILLIQFFLLYFLFFHNCNYLKFNNQSFFKEKDFPANIQTLRKFFLKYAYKLPQCIASYSALASKQGQDLWTLGKSRWPQMTAWG